MSFNIFDQRHLPEESYSRRLDRMVASQEYPYGYDSGEPPAGHANGPNSFPSHEQKGAYEAKGREIGKR